jgi:hypothetical protein
MGQLSRLSFCRERMATPQLRSPADSDFLDVAIEHIERVGDSLALELPVLSDQPVVAPDTAHLLPDLGHLRLPTIIDWHELG